MNRRSRIGLLLLLITGSLISLSCAIDGPGSSKDSNSNAEAGEKISDFDRELKALRTADYRFIFSIRRKDGKVFDSDDKKFVKLRTFKANRHTLTDNDKVIFVGSNYKTSDKNLTALKKRFEFEDFSKPEEEPEATNPANGEEENVGENR